MAETHSICWSYFVLLANKLKGEMAEAQRLRELIAKPLEDSVYMSERLRGVAVSCAKADRSDGIYRRSESAKIVIGTVHYVREVPPNVPTLVPDSLYWRDSLDQGSPEAIDSFGIHLLLSLALDRLWLTTIVGMHTRFLREMMANTRPSSAYTAELYGGKVMENFPNQIVPAFSMMLAFVANSAVQYAQDIPMVCALSLDKIDYIVEYVQYCNTQNEKDTFVPAEYSLENCIVDWHEWGSFMTGHMSRCHMALMVSLPETVDATKPIDVYANMDTFKWYLHMGFLSWNLFTQSMGTIGETLGHYIATTKSHPTEIGPIDRLYQWVKSTSMWIPRLSLMFTVCGICSRHCYQQELALILKDWVQHCNHPSVDGTVSDKHLRVAFEIHRRVNVELHMFQSHRAQSINGNDHRLRWLPFPIDQIFEMDERHVPVRSKGGIDEDTFVNCVVPRLIKGTFNGSQQYYFHH
jgi:hypothetical protein